MSRCESGEWRCPMFFMGTYTPKLDDKGRLFLPAKFRDQLAEGLVVTRGQENCLVVWPARRLRARWPAAAQAGADDRQAARGLHPDALRRRADEDSPTSRAGSRIPPMLREYAALERDVVVIGVMDRLEIWDPASWQEYSAGAGGVAVRRARAKKSSRADRTSTTAAQHKTADPQDEVSGPLPPSSGAPSPAPDGRPSPRPGSGQGPGRADPHSAPHHAQLPRSITRSGSRPMSIAPAAPSSHRRAVRPHRGCATRRATPSR